MRASSYGGAGRFTTVDTPMPKPAATEALLRVRRVGICGTDLHIFQGHLDHRVPKGGVIGHETFAEVAEAPAASGFKAGDRVVVDPVVSCGTCRACRMGGYYLCQKLKVLGVDAPGGMQEYWPVPVERLLHIPDTLSDDQAAVIEPLAVATHDVDRAAVNLYRMFERELTLQGARLYSRKDWEEAIRLAASGAVSLAPLVSRTIPLDALQEGMQQALAGGPVMKILVDVTR